MSAPGADPEDTSAEPPAKGPLEQLSPEEALAELQSRSPLPASPGAATLGQDEEGGEERGTGVLGRVLGGRYRIIGELGHGGMGTVFRAEDQKFKRAVAVKVLFCGPLDNHKTAERFIREAECLARLSHPNLLHVYDFGAEGELHYFAMELLEGRTLSFLIRVRQRLQPTELLPLAGQILSALDYVHRQGITHRDIKGGNVMVCGTRAVLMDFGLAKDEHFIGLTSEGLVLGTPEYMAPEQAEGSGIGPATDIYSFGVVLYEGLTGTVPFTGRSALAILRQHLETAPAPLESLVPGTDPRLCAVVARCLAKSPEERYPSCAALAADLAPICPTPDLVQLATSEASRLALAPSAAETEAGRGSVAEAGAPAELSGPVSAAPGGPPRRRAWVWVLGGCLVVAFLAGAALLGVLPRGPAAAHRVPIQEFSANAGEEVRLVAMHRASADPAHWTFEIECRTGTGAWLKETITGWDACCKRMGWAPLPAGH